MINKAYRSFFYILITLAFVTAQFTTAVNAAGDESLINVDETRRELRQLFARADWALLDQMGNQRVRAYEKDPNQFAAVRTFFNLLPNDKSPTGTLESHNTWVAQFPESYAAHYARARYYAYLAMAVRGGEFIEKVPQDRIRKMEEYFALSRADLLRSLKYSSRPSMTYFQLIRIARFSGAEKHAWHYYKKSTEGDPDILIIAEEYLRTLQPRWGGSYAALQSFPDEALKRGLSAPKAAQLKRNARWLEANDYKLYDDVANAKKLFNTIANDPADTEYSASAYKELAGLAIKDHDFETASHYYNQGLSRNPNNVRLLVGLASTARDLKRPQEALALYNRAIALAPDDIWALSGRGWLYHQVLKNDAAALPDVLKAAKLGDATAQSILGYLYWEGKVIARSQTDALYWWSKSAKQKHKTAEESLAFAKEMLGSNYSAMLEAANKDR